MFVALCLRIKIYDHQWTNKFQARANASKQQKLPNGGRNASSECSTRIIALTHFNCFLCKNLFLVCFSRLHVHEWWWINVSIMKRKFIMSSRGEWQKQIVLKLSLRWERRSASRCKFQLQLNCYSNDIIPACSWTCIVVIAMPFVLEEHDLNPRLRNFI